jgi:DNA helicase-2/ATP-dependent DNA helicase PcrA
VKQSRVCGNTTATSAQRVLDGMANQVDPIGAMSELAAPPRAGDAWTDLVTTLLQLRSGKAGWPAEIGCARLWYTPHLERMHEEASVRHADLLQLEQIAAGYPSRTRFLTDLTLDPPDATSDQAGVPLLDEDYLILSTIHSAKGQEWRSVFVLNVVDGCMPSDLGAGTTAEIEEERRLLYVAMTRAKDTLHLITPHRFFTYGQSSLGDRHVYAARSRFLPGSLLPLFESVTWPILATEVARRATINLVRVDIASRMRGMWR